MVAIVKNQLSKVDLRLGNVLAVVIAAFFVGCTVGWVGAMRSIVGVVCDGPNSRVLATQRYMQSEVPSEVQVCALPAMPMSGDHTIVVTHVAPAVAARSLSRP